MNHPRRRGTGLAAAAACALVLCACSDGDEALDPELRAPTPGTYSYEARVHTADEMPPDTFEGALQIAVASEDSIIATWDVPGYTGAPARGVWNITAYTLPADPTSVQGTISHRVWRENSGVLHCTLTYERVEQSDTFRTSSENFCSMVRD